MLAAVLAACSGGGSPQSRQPSGSSSARTPEAVVTFEPAPETLNFDPLGSVMVSVSGGTLVDVVMTNNEGRVVPGVKTPDRLAWKPDTRLDMAKRMP